MLVVTVTPPPTIRVVTQPRQVEVQVTTPAPPPPDTEVLPVPVQVIPAVAGVKTVTTSRQGPPGPQGIPGTGDGNVSTYPAGEILSGHRAVLLSGGQAFYVSQDNPAHLWAAVGITTGAAEQYADATIQTSGIVYEPSWAWTPEAPVFLGTNGVLTQTYPASGFALVLGIATDARTLNISIGTPMALGG